MHNSCVTVLIRVMSCRVFIAIQSFFFKCYCQKGRKVVDLFDETLLFKVSSFPAAAAFFFLQTRVVETGSRSNFAPLS